MIEIRQLCKNYGTLQAVRDISLSIPKGQVLGLLGPNGAGKSTTLRILTGFLEASSGEVTVGGYSVFDKPLDACRLIGYLPESTPLYENMLVYDYLHFIAQTRDIAPSQCADKILQAAKRCDILEFIHRPIGELSKGQRQRVGLAMAILDDPEVLILDEPTSGLDPNQIIGIRDIIRELGQEKTVIFSTHILSEAEATCDRVVIINQGQIAADGSLEDLKKGGQPSLALRIESNDAAAVKRAFDTVFGTEQNLQELQELQELLGEGAKVEYPQSQAEGQTQEVLVTLHGQHSGSEAVKQKIKVIIRDNDWFMLGMERKSQSLEDIFHELTN